MKKIIFIFLILFSVTIFSKDYINIYKGTPERYNNVWKKFNSIEFDIDYYPKEKVFYFRFNDVLTPVNIRIPNNQKKEKDKLSNKIIKLCNKYIEWVKIALENKAEIDKPLPKGELRNLCIVWKLGNEVFQSSDSFDIQTYVFSQNLKKHAFLLKFQKAYSTKNQFITIKPETLYFGYNDIIRMKKALSPENLSNAEKEFKKEQEKNDLFK
ncbi:hypothetical protein C0585_00630 [Candidatus Woesearchaeota archaeon]|nr:MAG: hypothetical protein C0585_00630 [Candidatus Woesearchaeota archaeon]